ncbi:MAG: peptide deformylase [Myxococcales bacterium]|nr:peptide deformylase [Myxococcales bacterium]
MAIRKIAQMGDPVLRRRAEEVPPAELASAAIQRLIDDMIETMRDADGAGIAAPQVNESLRISVIEVVRNPRYPDFPGIPFTVLVNPLIEPLVGTSPLAERDSIVMYEGCLSVNGIRGRVRRPRKVRVRGLDREGHALDFTWEGVPAAVVQHETDHLDGILFVDRADPRSLTFLREYDRYVPRELRLVDGVELVD